MANEKEEPKTPEEKLAPAAPTASIRFMNKVIAEFSTGVGELALSDFQKRLAQNYFVAIDAALGAADEKRLRKPEKYRDPLAVTWANVNMSLLARCVVAKARLGLDPAQKNHINMMPFKNNALNKYDIVFIDGYRGIELTAKKYGQDAPNAVIVELVYSNDKFKSFKKSLNNPVESFEFEIVDDFDRGNIKGGFYYHAYKDCPEKNKLVVMSLQEILKRKPAYASIEFWGGDKDVWKDGKKVGTEHVDGWYEKMCWKTMYRAAYGDITIDSQKVDANYLQLRQLEDSYHEAAVMEEIEAEANSEVIDVEFSEVDQDTGEVIDNSDKSDQITMPDMAPPASDPPKPDSPKGNKGKGKSDPF